MAAKANQSPAKPVTVPVLLGSVAAAGYAVFEGYPGLALIWGGIVAAAWMYQPAVFTGRKDARGYPTPAHEGEQAAMNKYRFWSDLKFKMFLPGRDWLPFNSISKKMATEIPLSFIAAVLAGTGAYFIPVSDPYTAGFGNWINAGAAFITVVQVAASRRHTMVADDECPGARIDSLITLAGTRPGVTGALAAAGVMIGGAAATAASVLLPIATTAAGITPVPEPAIWILLLSAGPLALLARPWITVALEHWRTVVAARAEWETRWMQLKQDPAPRLLDRREVGPAVIDSFEAPPGVGSAMFFTMGPKIGPTMGTASRFAVLSVDSLDSNNQPVPGTRHPGRFEIVNWPSDQLPDITDPNTPKDVVFELARSALVWMADEAGAARPILADIHPLTVNRAPETAAPTRKPVDPEDLVASWKTPKEDAEPARDGQEEEPAAEHQSPIAWAFTWYAPEGPPASFIRSSGRGPLSGILNTEVIIDHRAQGGAGCIYAGPLTDPATEYDPSVGVNAETMTNLDLEDTWDERWIEVMKMGTNPPVMQPATSATAKLKNGTVIEHMAFVTRRGMPPHDFFNYEPKMSTVLNAAPFVTMTGYADPARPSQRHAQAFSLYWSSGTVPTRPDELAPVRGSKGPQWALAGRVNEAFKVARLADRPEVASVTCLTKETSPKHIWKIDLYLHGGVTLAELRGAANKIKTHWGCQWLRIAHEQDKGMVSIVAGARPSQVRIAQDRHADYLIKLDWDQVFLDSGVSGLGGVLPVLRRSGTLPKNPDVQVLEFELPPGLDFTAFTAARPKLESNSGNAFVEPRKIKDRPNAVQLLVCEVNPMPEKAGYDWEHIKASALIPFATGIDGEPVEYNFKLDPHLLIAGASGGGKSVLLQSLAFGALVRGYELYVADPTKGGADFKFAEPYAKAFTATPFEAAAMMRGIYAEVVRRKDMNSAHGVGNYRDLPEDIRPKHIVILLDEFTSLMNPDPVPAPTDDPEMDIEREMVLATNRAKTEVGVFTGKIAREARSAGVTLFLATQKLSAKMLDTIPGAGDLKVNLSRLLMGKATYGDKQSALRAPQDAPELGDSIPPGRGLFETTAGAAMAIQAWYDPAEQNILAARIVEHRTPLAEAEKLDLARYMPKQQPVPGEVIRPEEDTIVDLGEIELELELDMDLEEEPAPAAAPAPVFLRDDTVAFLDIDGCIAADVHDADRLASGELVRLDSGQRGTVAYLPQALERLNTMGVPVIWCTNWDTDADEYFGRLLPAAVATAGYAGEESGWWKIDSVTAWLQANPRVRRVLWIDDMLAEEDSLLGVLYAETAAEALESLGVEHRFIIPSPDRGLDAAELDEAAAFAAGSEVVQLPPSPEEVIEEDREPVRTPEPVPAAAAPAASKSPGRSRTRKSPAPTEAADEFGSVKKAPARKRTASPDEADEFGPVKKTPARRRPAAPAAEEDMFAPAPAPANRRKPAPVEDLFG